MIYDTQPLGKKPPPGKNGFPPAAGFISDLTTMTYRMHIKTWSNVTASFPIRYLNGSLLLHLQAVAARLSFRCCLPSASVGVARQCVCTEKIALGRHRSGHTVFVMAYYLVHFSNDFLLPRPPKSLYWTPNHPAKQSSWRQDGS